MTALIFLPAEKSENYNGNQKEEKKANVTAFGKKLDKRNAGNRQALCVC